MDLNDVGLQTLTYNGQSYLQYPQSAADNLVGSALFRTPDGTGKPYGWATNTLDHDTFSLWNTATVISTSAVGYQDIYRSGLSDSVTVKISFSAPDANTLKVDAAITNNDPTDTLARISLGYFEPFQIPGPINTYYNVHDVVQAGNPATTDYGPTIFFKGTWGSAEIWPGDYSSPTGLGTYYGASAQTAFPISFSNFSANQIGHYYEDPIAPGTTKTYTTYFRFGSAADTPTSLAPEAYSSLRQAYPYLVNWPDRRPVARVILANTIGNGPSPTNPRGYFGEAAFDVSNQANFNSRMLGWADSMVITLNAMNPKPQGIMVWDLEGQEFYQYFSYVGYPNKLHDLAPEMDVVADAFFAKFRNAGYKIGIGRAHV